MNHRPFAYAVFHCNLAFSSIQERDHSDVIKRCYWPLLHLAEKNHFPIGIELTAFTLKRILNLDPAWVQKFRELLNTNKCELIGSGESQLIGPLVPHEVNEWNQQLGIEEYKSILGISPSIAYINEQAVSSSLLDHYLDAGYTAVFIEWDNLYSANPTWSKHYLNSPQQIETLSGRKITALWNWSVSFQKLQRVCHDQLDIEDYQLFIQNSFDKGFTAFPIYGNDAEVFNYRPGRFSEEANIEKDEWQQLTEVFTRFSAQFDIVLPCHVLKTVKNIEPLLPFNGLLPIAVKKQQKYNLTRWCLSGRNDLLLNTLCFHEYKKLITDNALEKEKWRQLCHLWSSDFRTHLTDDKHQKLIPALNAFFDNTLHKKHTKTIFKPIEDTTWLTYVSLKNGLAKIRYHDIDLCLYLKRGGAIKSLAFNNQPPIIGTIEHGEREHIALAADFYSNHTVAEYVTERKRYTDLSQAEVTLSEQEDSLVIKCSVRQREHNLVKYYELNRNGKLTCRFEFDNLERPIASIRLGYLTLLDNCENLHYACHNGGQDLEKFEIADNINHGLAISSLISSQGCLGATKGTAIFGNKNQKLMVTWLPENCAAMPMIQRTTYQQEQLNRLWFSLSEIDESHKVGGQLLNFEYQMEPYFE